MSHSGLEMKKIYKVQFMLLVAETNRLLYLESREIHSYELSLIGDYSIRLKEKLVKKYIQSYIVIKIK